MVADQLDDGIGNDDDSIKIKSHAPSSGGPIEAPLTYPPPCPWHSGRNSERSEQFFDRRLDLVLFLLLLLFLFSLLLLLLFYYLFSLLIVLVSVLVTCYLVTLCSCYSLFLLLTVKAGSLQGTRKFMKFLGYSQFIPAHPNSPWLILIQILLDCLSCMQRNSCKP